jgi:hypothetical protein
MRPLGIPVLEDKIVQQAVRMILEPIWENDFADESIGYRPGRGARKATQEAERKRSTTGNTGGSSRRTSKGSLITSITTGWWKCWKNALPTAA